MKERPPKGDWYHRVALDFEQVDIGMDEEVIFRTDLPTNKSLIKTAVWKVFLKNSKKRKKCTSK